MKARIFVEFLPRDATQSAVILPVVCQSACLSVCDV